MLMKQNICSIWELDQTTEYTLVVTSVSDLPNNKKKEEKNLTDFQL